MLVSEFCLGTVFIWGVILRKDQFSVPFPPRDTAYLLPFLILGFCCEESKMKQFDEI